MTTPGSDGTAQPRDKYRPDIDGMRAVAVLAVIAYHFTPANFPGGFIGVDIFFVISGYLITGILVKAIDEHEYPSFHSLLSDFYQRRIRRIFPALALVLAACLVTGWFVLFSSEYARLGKYVAAGAGYIENFVLWSEAGYFDHAAITKPLLHLWSLAVEEQFYIAWPLLLWLFCRRRWPLLTTIGVIALAAFVLNVCLVLNGQTTHAFYSPLSRTWELMTGAWLAVAHRQGLAWLPRRATAQACIGLALILAGFVFINPASAFPGFWAMLPVLGTALIINAGPTAIPNQRILSLRPVVWIGLISYPLYLWHWALYSFVFVVFGDGSAAVRHAAKPGLFLASLLLAWLTYRYVEAPIRRSRRNLTAVALVTAVAICGAAGLAIFMASGLPNRPLSLVSAQAERYVESMQMSPLADSSSCFNPQSRMTYLQRLRNKTALPSDWYCTLGDTHATTTVLAYGDSHARAMIPTLDRYGKTEHVRVVFSSIGSCLPLTGVQERTDYAAACAGLGRQSLQYAVEHQPRAVVMIAAWSSYLRKDTLREGNTTGAAALSAGLGNTLAQYQRLKIPVLLMEDNPLQRTAPPKARIRFSAHPSDTALNANAISRTRYEQQQADANAILQNVATGFPLASVMNVEKALCDASVCPWARDVTLLYYDSGHLSAAGSLRVYPEFAARMNAILGVTDAANTSGMHTH